VPQNYLEHLSSQELPSATHSLPNTSSLPCLGKHLSLLANSNGRLGLGPGSSLGRVQAVPGQGVATVQCLGLGDCGPGLGGGPGPKPLVQELAELEGQILVIKQQLQTAMRRKRELEEYQSTTSSQPTNQTTTTTTTTTATKQSASHPSNQLTQNNQPHQQTSQHTNTLPEF